MNVNFQYAKTLAGEGAILLLLGIVPTVGWVLGIVGIVLLLKATKELSYYYQDENIYRNALTGLKYYVVALIAAAVAIGAGVIIFASTGLFAGITQGLTAGIVGGIVTIIAGLIVAFIFYVLAASHLKQTFETLAQKSGEQSLSTAGTLLWIGSLLTIIGVGLLLIFIAWIFATIGFFGMKSREYQPYSQNGNSYYNNGPGATSQQTQPAQQTQPQQAATQP
jgi:uncharacterized membrane protein